jgi:hypothetical protein
VEESCLDKVDACDSVGEDYEGEEGSDAQAVGEEHVEGTLEAGAEEDPCCEGEVVDYCL